MASFQEKSHGKLSIVATPIGNLGDITLRALDTIRDADVVVAEDTRRTRGLMSHYGISKKVMSCHAFNERRAVAGILSLVLDKGLKVAVISDAGTPVISDPGFLMIREARNMGIEPEFLPGVSALTFAAAASGLPMDKFSFFGFLPVKKGRREALLRVIKAEGRTAFLFESPFRVCRLLEEVLEVMGSRAQVALVREATKMHEEVVRGTAGDVLEKISGSKCRGEFVVGIFPEAGESLDGDRGTNT